MLTKNDVLQKAIDLFEGNESAALNWCNEPNRALQWKTPSEIMDSEEGGVESCHAHFSNRARGLFMIYDSSNFSN